MFDSVRKSIYVYLSALLGVLLFLTLHRVVVFFYLVMAAYGYEPLAMGVSTIQFLALEYVTLFLVMMLGGWYGIWLGLYWYEKVYESGEYGGILLHLSNKFMRRPKTYNLQSKMEAARKKLESGVWELEDLAATVPAVAAPPVIKRKVVRRRAPRKINASK